MGKKSSLFLRATSAHSGRAAPGCWHEQEEREDRVRQQDAALTIANTHNSTPRETPYAAAQAWGRWTWSWAPTARRSTTTTSSGPPIAARSSPVASAAAWTPSSWAPPDTGSRKAAERRRKQGDLSRVSHERQPQCWSLLGRYFDVDAKYHQPLCALLSLGGKGVKMQAEMQPDGLVPGGQQRSDSDSAASRREVAYTTHSNLGAAAR